MGVRTEAPPDVPMHWGTLAAGEANSSSVPPTPTWAGVIRKLPLLHPPLPAPPAMGAVLKGHEVRKGSLSLGHFL